MLSMTPVGLINIENQAYYFFFFYETKHAILKLGKGSDINIFIASI